MAARNNRDQFVLATKFTDVEDVDEVGLEFAERVTDAEGHVALVVPAGVNSVGKGNTVNACGNHKRNMTLSVRDSLRKLQTDFIDGVLPCARA
jgi:aryl-alcohol dehydrogenase-like predicted oxidoreductase